MAKSKKRKKRRTGKLRVRLLNRKQTSIAGEADYIINRAMQRDSRVVTLGALVFFSTETGDAWMLDPEDQFALCLAQEGEPQPYYIDETDANFKIEWTAEYEIEGDKFIVAEQSGRVRTIFGYPISEILQAIDRTLNKVAE
jgi:hypothetical protein